MLIIKHGWLMRPHLKILVIEDVLIAEQMPQLGNTITYFDRSVEIKF